MAFSDDQIKEIADQLECGFRCFIHKQKNELLFIPDSLRNPEMDMDIYDEENNELETNFFDYYEIKAIQSNDSFQMMVDFVDALDDSSKLKEKLYYALNRPKPFRNFKNIIDCSGAYRQEWFDYKNNWLMEWVVKELKGFESRDKSLI